MLGLDAGANPTAQKKKPVASMPTPFAVPTANAPVASMPTPVKSPTQVTTPAPAPTGLNARPEVQRPDMPTPNGQLGGAPTTVPKPNMTPGTTTPAPHPVAIEGPGSYAATGANPNELRGQVFSPGASANTSGLQMNVADLVKRLTASLPSGGVTPGADTTALRGSAVQQALGAQAPDRQGLALSTFDRLVSDSQPQFQSDLRAVGQKAAAFGRAGSGMTTSDLGDVSQRREQALASARGSLANNAAGLSLQDQLAQLQATSGLYGQLGGEDRANAGLALDQFGAGSNLLGQVGNLEGQSYNEDVSGRNEMRTERDFQNQQSQQAIQNQIQQLLTQDQLYGNEYDRNLRGEQVNAGLGFGDTGASTLANSASQYGQQAAQGGQGLQDATQNWSYLDYLDKLRKGQAQPQDMTI